MANGDIDLARFSVNVTLLFGQLGQVVSLGNQQFPTADYDNVKSVVLETTGGNSTKQVTVAVLGRKLS